MLDVVQGAQERVGGLAGKVEGNVLNHAVLHIFPAVGLVLDVAGGDGAVLPVDGAVGVGVGRDHDFGLREGLLFIGVLGPVQPSAGGDAHLLVGAVILDLAPEPATL